MMNPHYQNPVTRVDIYDDKASDMSQNVRRSISTLKGESFKIYSFAQQKLSYVIFQALDHIRRQKAKYHKAQKQIDAYFKKNKIRTSEDFKRHVAEQDIVSLLPDIVGDYTISIVLIDKGGALLQQRAAENLEQVPTIRLAYRGSDKYDLVVPYDEYFCMSAAESKLRQETAEKKPMSFFSRSLKNLVQMIAAGITGSMIGTIVFSKSSQMHTPGSHNQGLYYRLTEGGQKTTFGITIFLSFCAELYILWRYWDQQDLVETKTQRERKPIVPMGRATVLKRESQKTVPIVKKTRSHRKQDPIFYQVKSFRGALEEVLFHVLQYSRDRYGVSHTKAVDAFSQKYKIEKYQDFQKILENEDIKVILGHMLPNFDITLDTRVDLKTAPYKEKNHYKKAPQVFLTRDKKDSSVYHLEVLSLFNKHPVPQNQVFPLVSVGLNVLAFSLGVWSAVPKKSEYKYPGPVFKIG